MNVFAKCISVMLFLLVSLYANATVEPTVSIRSQKNQSFSLHLEDLNHETYRIKLMDRKGIVLVRELVKHQEDYLQFFNLSNLPAGDYRLYIESDERVIVQPIQVKAQKVVVDAATRQEMRKTDAKSAKKLPTTAQAINNKIKWIQSNK